jgi:hypothetical protein
MQWHTPLMQNLKARERIKEFVFFSLILFYETIIGHIVSVFYFLAKFRYFFIKKIGKILQFYFSSVNSTNFAIILLNFTKFWHQKNEKEKYCKACNTHLFQYIWGSISFKLWFFLIKNHRGWQYFNIEIFFSFWYNQNVKFHWEVGDMASRHWWRGLALQPVFATYWVHHTRCRFHLNENIEWH